MDLLITPEVKPTASLKATSTRRQIRGSSLMLVGRLISMGMGFAVQVLIVRYLSQTEYGAFAYALSIVAFAETIASLGLDRTITRFLPIYDEKHDYNKLFGSIVMMLATVVGLGLVLSLLVFLAQGFIGQTFIREPQALALLLILILLSPIRGANNLFRGMMTVFARPRAIFFRRYIVAPGLELLVVLLLVFGVGDVYLLAAGYLAVGVLGLLIYVALLFSVMRGRGMFRHLNLRTLDLPGREIFSFTLPLLSTDVVYLARNAMNSILLGFFSGAVEVAVFAAVLPVAKLNQLVFSSFGLLFMPTAARLFARNDHEGIRNLYSQVAVWIAVISFPIFALTFALAQPVTELLFGSRYAASGPILALLTLGYYFNAALGQNTQTLRVLGLVRFMVTVDIASIVINLAFDLMLIPPYGALGAAIATLITLVAYNVLMQAGVHFKAGINLFQGESFKIYLLLSGAAAFLLLIQVIFAPPLYVSLAMVGIVSLVVITLSRRTLQIGQTFPELMRIPLMRRLFGS